MKTALFPISRANPAARGFDWGIGNWGEDNEFSKNHVTGFLYPFDGVDGGKNKALPSA